MRKILRQSLALLLVFALLFTASSGMGVAAITPASALPGNFAPSVQVGETVMLRNAITRQYLTALANGDVVLRNFTGASNQQWGVFDELQSLQNRDGFDIRPRSNLNIMMTMAGGTSGAAIDVSTENSTWPSRQMWNFHRQPNGQFLVISEYGLFGNLMRLTLENGNIVARGTGASESGQLWETILPTEVRFDYRTNGGDADSLTRLPGDLFEGTVLTPATLPLASKTNSRFLGWHTDPTSSVALQTFRVGSENVTLFAIFRDSHEVRYNIGENTTSLAITSPPFPRVYAGDPVNLSYTADRPGHRFLGWNTVSDARDGLTAPQLMPNHPLNLFAIFLARQRVDFSALNGSVSREYAMVFPGDLVDLSPTATREHGRFRGWVEDLTVPNPVPLASFPMPDDPTTLYALFEDALELTFDYRDDTYSTVRYFADDAVSLSRTATREHARFLGWHYERNSTTPLTEFEMPSGNTTLFAIFHDAPRLTFCERTNGDGSTQTIGRYFEGDVVDLTAYSAMPRENARFLGWNTRHDPPGRAVLTSFTMPHDADFTLHAIFEDALELTFDFGRNAGTEITGVNLSNICTEIATAYFFAGEPVDLSPIATRPGWEFVGWNSYENRNAHTVLTEFTMPNEPTRLYAIFRRTIVATFIDYNDAGRQTRTQTFTIYNHEQPPMVTLPVQHNRTGWVIRDWTTQPTASIHTNRLPAGEAEFAYYFYGLYESPVVLSYDSQGAEERLPVSQQLMRIINSYDSSAPYNPTFRIAAAPQRAGHFLVEWTTGSESFAPGAPAVFGEDTLLTAVWAPGEAPEHVPVTGITLSAPPGDLNVGDPLTLIATVLPLNATERGVRWESSNTAVATVGQQGDVVVQGIGTAVITATTMEGNFTATATITVTPVELSGISLPESNATIVVGQSLPLEVTLLPSNAANRNVTWSSNNPAIVEVVSAGRVRGVAIGDAIITVTAENGMTASMNVTVAPIRVQHVNLSLNPVFHVGDMRRIGVEIQPFNATNRNNITWSSSSAAVSVNADGLVTAHHLGIATITATIDGQQFSIGVDVRPILVTDITLLPNEAEIVVGNTRQIHETITPHNAVNADLTWSTSAAGIATVDTDGLVTARGIGTAIITASTQDGTVAATARITVLPILVEHVTVRNNALEVRHGQTRDITAFVLPVNATDQRLTWSSSDTAVATVDQNGRVTARSAGTATITATARDGSGASATTIITVPPRLVQNIRPSHWPFVSTEVGQQFPLTVTVSPFDACNPAYRVTVSDSRIIRYDNGVVTALAQGTAYVNFAALDGSGVIERTRVIVHRPVLVQRVRLPFDTVTLDVGESVTLPPASAIPTYASNPALAIQVSDPAILRYANGTLTRLAAGEAFVAVVATDGGDAFAIVQVLESPPTGLQGVWNTVVDTVVNVVVAVVSVVVYVVTTVFAEATQMVTELITQITDVIAGRRSGTTGVAWPFHNTGTAGQVNPVEDIWIPDFGWVPSPWGVNSYLYAINVRTAPTHAPDDGLLIQRYATLAMVRDAVLADVRSRGRTIRIIDGADAPIQTSTEYRFALRVGNQPLIHDGVVIGNVWDYRFMVQTDTGAWAYKQGWYQQAVNLGYIDPCEADWSHEFAYEFGGQSHVAEFENFFNSDTIFFAATRNDNY